MLLIDVNVVLAAHRSDHPHYDLVRPWFDMVLARERPFAVPLVVWHSFLRLATNRRIFEIPTPRVEAFAFLEAVCAQPHHRLVGIGDRHLALLREVCDDAEASGDLVPDAVIAALALEHGSEVVTLDRDFARFASVASRRPGGD